MKRVDLRSDTVTQPTDEMRAAMEAAPVGDDMMGEDPTVNALQERAAEITGKEAALFVSSGTMGNQLAVLSQTSPGDEIICEKSSHLFVHEQAALARIALVQAACVEGIYGVMPLDAVRRAVRPKDDHMPRTSLICVENTHNLHGGTVIPQRALAEICAFAHYSGIPVHMDGARLFNAAVASGVSVREITRQCATVSFCLSKGLSAPIGAMLCGPMNVIEKARRYRMLLGGAMRQSGIIAAAGIVALDTMIPRLEEDHKNAKRLANAIAHIPGLSVDIASVETNIVYFNIEKKNAAIELEKALAKRGVLLFATEPERLRAVTHRGIGEADIDAALEIISRTVKEI